MHWGALTAVVAAALPLHEARAHLEPGDAPRVQIHVAPDGTVNATEGPIPRAEPTILEASTARQVSLVEAQAGAQGRPVDVQAAEREKGQELYESGRFSWENEHFKADYEKEFGKDAPDDGRTGLVQFLRCFVPHGMFAYKDENDKDAGPLHCLAHKLMKKQNEGKEKTTKEDAIEFIIKVGDGSGDDDGDNCFQPDESLNPFFKGFGEKFEKCVWDGPEFDYRSYVKANLEEFAKNPNEYNHNLLNGDGSKPMLEKKTPRQIQSAFFHHLLDAHQSVAKAAKHSWGGYPRYDHLLNSVYKGKTDTPFSINKFLQVYYWAQLNTVMDMLGKEGPIGATQLWSQLGMDKKLPPSVEAAAKLEKAGAMWPAFLLLLAA